MGKSAPRAIKNKIYIQQNADKKKHQKWGDEHHPTTDLINLPRPYAMLLNAQPNSGKSMVVKNILLHMKPTPQNIYIAHAESWDSTMLDPKKEEDFINTELEEIPEYAGIKAVFFKSFPPIQWWDKVKGEHNLLIIDDVNVKEWASCSRIRANIIDKTWSYLRTHRNLTIICAVQSIYQQLTPSVYRFSNVFILWKLRDKYIQGMIGRVCGIDCDLWKKLFSLCQSPYDNVMIDETLGSPARYRFNLSKKIVVEEEDDSSDSSSESDSC